MKNINEFDRIVFENRNMKYGAYWLRSTYLQRLKSATIIVSACMLLLTLLFLGFKKPTANPHSLKVTLEEKIYTIEMPPLPELKQQKQANTNSKKIIGTGVSNKVISATTTPVITATARDTNSLVSNNQAGGGTQTGGGATGTDTSSNVTTSGTNGGSNLSAINIAEEMPEFPGGYAALKQFIVRNYDIPNNVDLPEKGFRIVVNFIVNEKGEITNPTVVQGFNAACDKEALRVLSKMPSWKPGKQGGRPVNVIYNLPISIKFSY